MFLLQLAGSMLAIPVGLASAYSIYHANFAPETACQNLRANIVAMIDKQIDAATRRMLVRHDVETFEESCGSFDPDAKAAFKVLLSAAPPKAAPVAVPEPVKAQAPAAVTVKEKESRKAETHRAETHKAEPRKAEAHKAEAHSVAPAAERAARPATREPVQATREPVKDQARPAAEQDAASDARWLDAVRGALVTHEPEHRAPASAAKPLGTLIEHELAAPATPAAPVAPAVRAPREADALPVQTPREMSAPDVHSPLTAPVAVPAPVESVPAARAPILPPPTELSAAPPKAAQPAAPDHPVPPGSIPMDQSDAAPDVPAAPASTGSTPAHNWTSYIPFVGH
jgi:hypothetical protein